MCTVRTRVCISATAIAITGLTARELEPQAGLIESDIYQRGTTSARLSPEGLFHYVTKVRR